jgi:hypothetical protein
MSIRRAIVITGAGVWAGVPWARAQTMRQHRIAILSNTLPPADMAGTDPIEQPTRFELAIHRGAVLALDLTLPQRLMLRADAVIG